MGLFRPRRLIVLAALAALGAVLAVGAGAATRSSSTAAAGTVVKVRTTGLGKAVADSRGFVLYMFLGDKGKRSSCYGSCAGYWPPVLTKGTPKATAGAKAGLLGMTKRKDGKLQVTYAGHPLYRFALDSKAGQTKGEGLDDFGAHWYAVSAAGKKIVVSTDDHGGSTTTGTGTTTTDPYGYGGGGGG
jgi:predicted lipoprotein with Yx(FWY)xxD motif